ncbi:MAG: AbrB/MazE/SpoVT family DNA-binding domain-containing protein [Bryobacterales bacterium]|nr:AbrB/MazE/SpoVT family DNA-binding domain-containing protein [Bryobacterales bacterium]
MERVLPSRVRRQAGFKTGDTVEVRAIGGIVTLISKPQLSEQTSQEARQVLEEVDEACKGPYYGPFYSAQEFSEFLERYKSQPRAQGPKTKKRR